MDAKSKALKAHRARLKRRGLKRLEISVPADEAPVIRRAASVLREQSSEAARLRQILGFPPEPGRAVDVIDFFAMPEPLSAAGEALWDDAMARIEKDRKDPTLSGLRKSAR
jgi:hypothetical protein